MKKREFLEELDRILLQNKYSDREEVINDFEEHFRIGEEEGKSEEEIAKLLGKPKDIAEQFKEEKEEKETEESKIKNETAHKEKQEVRTENNGATKLMIALCLIFFNLVFVVGIVAGVFGALLGFIGAFIGVTIAGIALVIAGILGLILGTVILPTSLIALTFIFGGIGTTSLGILGTMFAVWASVQTFKAVIKYCEWNVKVIRGGI